jgi:cystathionine beta-lyase/cystathionine gamma-synthase
VEDERPDDREEQGFATRAIHAGEVPREAERPVAPPIWLTAHYGYDSLEHYADLINERRPGYVYGRYGSPTHTALHDVLASLDDAEAAWSFASGMAAMHTVLTTLVESGGHVVSQKTVYGGTFALLAQVFPRYGIEATFVGPTPGAVAAAIRDDTAFVGVEPLANPTFRVTDVRGIATVCAERGTPLIVDNSVGSPYLLRPLTIPGATLVVHSTSKYIAGHADVIGGSVAGSRELVDRIRHMAIEQGTTAGSFDAWLVLRGVQTLPLRMERQCSNAMALAGALDGHPKVSEVGYSGLPSHPDHELATNLFERGLYGATLSFSLRDGYDAASRWAKSLRVAIVGSSFGGLWTEVTHPGSTSHRQLSPEERAAAGIGDGLIRVAVGAEDPGDLVADFLRALEDA